MYQHIKEIDAKIYLLKNKLLLLSTLKKLSYLCIKFLLKNFNLSPYKLLLT